MVGTGSRPAVPRERLLMKVSWFKGVSAGDGAGAATSPAGIHGDLAETSASSSIVGANVELSGRAAPRGRERRRE